MVLGVSASEDVLPNLESADPPALVAVMTQLALVCMPLCHCSQLIIPLQFHHVCCRWLFGGTNSNPGSESVVLVQGLLLLGRCQAPVEVLPTEVAHSRVTAHGVRRCEGAIGRLARY